VVGIKPEWEEEARRVCHHVLPVQEASGRVELCLLLCFECDFWVAVTVR
jgi:hypothetical protein